MSWWRGLTGWQKRRLCGCFFSYVIVAVVFLCFSCDWLRDKRVASDVRWDTMFDMPEETVELVKQQSANATVVSTGTYIENIKEVSLRNSYFDIDFTVWFEWQGDPELDMANNYRIYNGTISNKEIVQDYHEDGQNYQLVRCTSKISKTFHTERFPLESHELKFYIESNVPCYRAVLKADKENSGINPDLRMSGFNVINYGISEFAYAYDFNGSPEYAGEVVSSELLTAVEIDRATIGLYIKCFVSLFATTLWSLITVYLCAFHRLDPLGMIPSALFGTVANVMVGANLLPDALNGGLLEFVNIWGVATVLWCAIAIINVNRVRKEYEDPVFAKQLGLIMFVTILTITLAGHILLPCMAYGGI